jgi:hypothetical protein
MECSVRTKKGCEEVGTEVARSTEGGVYVDIIFV